MAPRLREDLVATTVEEQGVSCVEVTDPITATSFRFYDFEYALAQQLTGQPLAGVIAWAEQTFGVDLTREALDQFIEKVAGLGFLVSGHSAPLLDSDPTGPFEDQLVGPPSSHDLLPRLQVLSGPLPPVPQPESEAPSSPLQPLQPLTEAKVGDSGRIKARPEVAPSDDTPFGAIIHAIASEASGPPPLGALDAPFGGSSVASTAKDAPESRDSWAATLAESVNKPRADRRQPPRPEVVVMAPVAEPSAAVRVPRRRSFVWLFLLVLGGAGGAAAWFFRPVATGPTAPPAAPSVPSVHVVTPQPTTFYRWFDTVGVVVPGRNETLAFSSAGRVQDVMPPGTTFSAGETIARLQGVVAREITVNRLRARVAFAEQLRGSSLAEGNQAAAHLAESKLAARKQELADAQAALAAWEIHPKVTGAIAEVLVQKGDYVKADAPVFRIRATGPRATFSLPAADMTRARALTFCRLETIPGTGGADGGATEGKERAIDCTLAAGAPGDEHLTVDLVGAVSLSPGAEVRLASARYDGVFPVPASALKREGGVDHLWIVSSGAERAENRVVEVAATVEGLVLVAHGIGVGEAIVVDPPAGLKTGGEVSVAR